MKNKSAVQSTSKIGQISAVLVISYLQNISFLHEHHHLQGFTASIPCLIALKFTNKHITTVGIPFSIKRHRCLFRLLFQSTLCDYSIVYKITFMLQQTNKWIFINLKSVTNLSHYLAKCAIRGHNSNYILLQKGIEFS